MERNVERKKNISISDRGGISNKRRKGSRKGIISGLNVAIFACFCLFFAIANLVVKDKEVSDTENRKLALRPEISREGVVSGEYFKDADSHYNDQFVMRDRWILFNSGFDLAIGKRSLGGVIYGRDGYLLAKPEAPDIEALSESARAMSLIADRYSADVRAIIVPDSAAILDDKLPAAVDVRNQAKDIEAFKEMVSEEVRFTDAFEILKKHKDEYIYFKTDHHWTSDGAKVVFEEGIGWQDYKYTGNTVSDSFRGTQASRAGVGNAKDSITLYTCDTDIDYYVYYQDTKESSASMFQTNQLKKKDQYQVYFGGNHPVTELHTTADTMRNLLLFKDSYANSFIQFVYPYFENIIMIDPRYYYGNGDDIENIIEGDDITDIWFLYSADTLMSDHALADCILDE